jgi:dihydropyrimidinase
MMAIGSAGGRQSSVLKMMPSLTNYIVISSLKKVESRYHPLSHLRESEEKVVERVLALVFVAKSCVLTVYVFTHLYVGAIHGAQSHSQAAFGESSPQYLLLTDDNYSRPDFKGVKYNCLLPLSNLDDQEAVW